MEIPRGNLNAASGIETWRNKSYARHFDWTMPCAHIEGEINDWDASIYARCNNFNYDFMFYIFVLAIQNDHCQGVEVKRFHLFSVKRNEIRIDNSLCTYIRHIQIFERNIHYSYIWLKSMAVKIVCVHRSVIPIRFKIWFDEHWIHFYH